MISADFVVFKIDMNSHADIIRSKDPNQYNLETGVMKIAHNIKMQVFALILISGQLKRLLWAGVVSASPQQPL